jgi:hypothetical protein
VACIEKALEWQFLRHRGLQMPSFLEPANRLPALAAAQFMISKKNAGAVAARLADDDCLTSQQFCCGGNILPRR